MRALRLRWPTLAALLLVAVACTPEIAPPPRQSPTIVDVGIHRIGFMVPPGWLHADHGMEQLFEQGMAHIRLVELGPATPDGFAETLRKALELFEQNQWEDARTLLVSTNPRRFFASEKRWKSVQADWKSITWIRREKASGDALGTVDGEVDWEVRGAFHDLLVQVSALRRPDLSEIAEDALFELGHDAQRSIASEEAVAISGKPALRIETWDRLSHLGRQSYLFVLSEGRLLCLWTQLGSMETVDPAFESLVASLTIEPPHVAGEGGVGAGGV
jgi:hypothetical protein